MRPVTILCGLETLATVVAAAWGHATIACMFFAMALVCLDDALGEDDACSL